MTTEPTLEGFADEVTAFFDANAERISDSAFIWGEGDDDASIFVEADPETERRDLKLAKEFRAARFDAGLGWIRGPKQYGGRQLSREHELLYASIATQYRTAPTHFFGIGLGMVAPTILAHAQEHVRERYLAKLYRGDIVACQLFSEPGAGSDLASVATRAERDGDEWVVTGQKVWTTNAHLADIGEVVVRTDPSLPKHQGLSMFLVDMRAPGVEVRPLRQITGGASFNEVFFEGVRIPDDHRLGEVNDGWRVALTTLLNERASIGASGEASASLMFLDPERLIAMLQHFGRDEDPLLRQELARFYSGAKIAVWSGERAMAKIRAGQTPGPELSMAKLARTNNLRRAAELVGNVLGPRLAADAGEWGTFAWTRFVLGVAGLRIAGGSDEIQRKILGEQVLGLPKEPGPEHGTKVSEGRREA